MSKKRQIKKNIAARADNLPGRILFHCPNCRRGALATLKSAGVLAIPTKHKDKGEMVLALAVMDQNTAMTALENDGHTCS